MGAQNPDPTRPVPSGAGFLLWALLLVFGAGWAGEAGAVRIRDVEPEPVPKRTQDGYYLSVGVGFGNIDGRGVGVRMPLGLRYVSNRFRLIASANALDLAFLEGSDRDPRYVRPFVNSTLCVDGQTGFRVANYRCSGGTDLIGSYSGDLAYVIADEVWIAAQPGKLFAGLGYRHLNPATFYGTLGLFFDQPGQTAGGFKLIIGDGFVAMGLLWAFDMRPFF